jgi:hypothetical protein
MSSKRVEAYRRTTARLIEQDRAWSEAKRVISHQSSGRRAELAAGLIAELAAENPDAAEAGILSDMATALLRLKVTISQRAVAGSATGETSRRALDIPAAAPVPSTVPPAAFTR